MSLKSDFFNSWKNVEAKMKLDIEKNMSIFGEVKPSELLRSYQSFVKRWETDVFYEGEWLESVGKPEFKREFLQCINNMHFDVAVQPTKSNPIGAIIAVAGFAALWVIRFAFSASWILSVAIALIITAIGISLQVNASKKGKQAYNSRVKDEILKILNDKRDEIGRLCDRYDG